jgi:hypothetical protein
MPEASIVLKQQMPYRQHCIKHTPDRQQHKDIFPGSHPLSKSLTKRASDPVVLMKKTSAGRAASRASHKD